jgi:hypothetical protein
VLALGLFGAVEGGRGLRRRRLSTPAS